MYSTKRSRSLPLSQPPGSILVFRFSSIGDLLLISPALEALRKAWPDTDIFLAVKASIVHLVEHNPNIAKIIALKPGEGIFPFYRRLRVCKPEAILDLHNSSRSRILRLLLPSLPTVVWKKRSGLLESIGVRLLLQRYHAPMPIAHRFHQAVEKLTDRSLPYGKLRYFPGPQNRQLGQSALESAGVELQQPIVGIAPGAKWKTKRWPAEYFHELCRRAVSEGWQIILTGSAAELDLIERVAKGLQRVYCLCDLPLNITAAVVNHCRAFVSNDSALMHIARSQGVPTLAIFGSTDPGMFAYGDHALAYNQQSCSPCSFYGRSFCPRLHFGCMYDLHPAHIWQQLKSLLSSPDRLPLLTA